MARSARVWRRARSMTARPSTPTRDPGPGPRVARNVLMPDPSDRMGRSGTELDRSYRRRTSRTTHVGRDDRAGYQSCVSGVGVRRIRVGGSEQSHDRSLLIHPVHQHRRVGPSTRGACPVPGRYDLRRRRAVRGRLDFGPGVALRTVAGSEPVEACIFHIPFPHHITGVRALRAWCNPHGAPCSLLDHATNCRVRHRGHLPTEVPIFRRVRGNRRVECGHHFDHDTITRSRAPRPRRSRAPRPRAARARAARRAPRGRARW